MADDWKTQELQLGTVKFTVRHVSQRRRNEIAKQAQTRGGETDWDKHANLMARDTIAGWTDLTPFDALGWGFDDYEKLPVDADGRVPFTEDTASLLYRECLISQFRNHLDECSLSIAREVAQAKKRLAA